MVVEDSRGQRGEVEEEGRVVGESEEIQEEEPMTNGKKLHARFTPASALARLALHVVQPQFSLLVLQHLSPFPP